MIRIGILGDIGSGKSYVAKTFRYPVFNADHEVSKLYKTDKKIFFKLKKILPKYIFSFPVEKSQLSNAILANNLNLKKIINIVHKEIRKKLFFFLKKNKNKKFIILDIPLLLENKINNKKDVLVYVDSKKDDIIKNLKKRRNLNLDLLKKFKVIQLPLDYKKKNLIILLKTNLHKNLLKLE